jgi:hypothetical protein
MTMCCACVFDARSAIFPLAHSACWNAGWVDTNVVSPTARPTFEMEARRRKEPGKKGATNSQVRRALNTREEPKRKLRGRGGGAAAGGGGG